MSMRLSAIVMAVATVVLATVGRAAAPDGCEGSAWPLATEIAWITAEDRLMLPSGAKINGLPGRAIELTLVREADATLAALPTGKPESKPETPYAGTVDVAEVAEPGTYQVTLSTGGWIDVIEGGRPLPDLEHTGLAECPSARKSVRFALGPGPVVLQITSVSSPKIIFTIRKLD